MTTSRLPSRMRYCLQALVAQGEWPAMRGDYGWRGSASQAGWAPDTHKLLARLAVLGLAADESTMSVGSRVGPNGEPQRGSIRTRRYVPTAQGKEIAAQ